MTTIDIHSGASASLGGRDTAYLFDLAGVIINLDLETDTRELHFVGLPDFSECLKRPEIYEPMLSYLNGLSSEEAFLKAIHPVCRPDATDEEILWSMDAVLGDIPPTRLQFCRRLRSEGHKVYLLSNIYDRGWRRATEAFRRAGFEPEECFDKLFLSHEMQLAKPDLRIFQAVIDATGLCPGKTHYYDDTLENITAAQSMGFLGHHVPMNKLEEILVP